MIRVTCPTCSETRDFAAHLAGWEVRCFWCQNPLSIPEELAPAESPRAVRVASRRRVPVARRLAEVAPRPARRRANRLSVAGWVGVVACGVTLFGTILVGVIV